jgi:hypothetical protein
MNDPEAEKRAIRSAVNDLLEGHYHEAEDAQDENGKFSVSFTATITRGDPVNVKTSCRISRGSIKDEVEQDIIPNQTELDLP